MPHFSESIDIARPPEAVWRTIATPERWFDGYLETRSRSPEYPGPQTRDEHLFRTRIKEEGRAFSRHLRYSLESSNGGTHLRVDDDVEFKGLGKLAAPIASRDIKKRWETSLETLKVAAERQE